MNNNNGGLHESELESLTGILCVCFTAEKISLSVADMRNAKELLTGIVREVVNQFYHC